jgi:FdhD protein
MIPSYPIRYHFYQMEKWEPVDAETVVEAPVSLTVNSEVWLTFMCTPVQLEAMAVGFLFNEGVIENASEVADVRACEHGDNVDVWLKHDAEKPTGWRRTSGCTGGVTSVAETDEPLSSRQVNGASLTPGQISRLIDLLFDSQELYRETGGVHTSVLSDGERIIFSAEDIGRHNTLDKIAGLCLMQQIAVPHRILLTTGRISSEMLQKAGRIGASVLISRTSPSSLSIQMAERRGITLIGYARRRRFNVYTHPQRIIDPALILENPQKQNP